MNTTAIAIVAIISWAIVALANGRKGKSAHSIKWQNAESKIVELEDRISVMSERIEVLEKIVTDEQYDLKKAFDNLDK